MNIQLNDIEQMYLYWNDSQISDFQDIVLYLNICRNAIVLDEFDSNYLKIKVEGDQYFIV